MTRYLFAPGSDRLLARTSSGGTIGWYVTDKLGSVIDIVDTSGTSIYHATYDAFGNIASESNASNGDRFKFVGMQFDSVTGIYFDQARYYDPASGRFISQDPLGLSAGDANVYRYVFNSPTNYVDPSGMMVPVYEKGPDGNKQRAQIQHGHSTPMPWPKRKSEEPRLIWGWEDPNNPLVQLWNSTIGHTVYEAQTLAANTADMNPLQRAYVVGGTMVVSFVGVRGLSDAFSQHDAVDGHEQSRLERGLDGVLGAAQIFTSGLGISQLLLRPKPPAPSAPVSDSAARMAEVRAKGQAGEIAATVTKPKVGIRGPVSGKMRFSDEFIPGLLKESKNVAKQGLTAQIKDYIAIAKAKGVQFELWVRKSTKISRPLESAFKAGDVVFKYFEGL